MSRRRKGQSRIQAETWAVIAEKIRLDWSPEQISGWLLKHHQTQVSHEWIYQYILIDKQAGIDFFFAHPYAAWERGANENRNGLVRQYIPKNRRLSSVTNLELEQIMIKLNHRPGKCLDFRLPFEVFFEILLHLRVESKYTYIRIFIANKTKGVYGSDLPFLLLVSWALRS